LPGFSGRKLLILKRRLWRDSGELPPDWLFSTKSQILGRAAASGSGAPAFRETFIRGADLCTKNPRRDAAKPLKNHCRKSC
jgi:hypothetical protein